MSTQPTVRDVAALARVSVGTVSHVINHPERVAPATRQRVHDAVAELGWLPHSAAQRLASRRQEIATPEAKSPGAGLYRAEVDLALGADSPAVHALVFGLTAYHAVVRSTGSDPPGFTLFLSAETAEQATLRLLGLVLPLNCPVLRLEVTAECGSN
jgi:hypothetical protein